jgi:hypothetical protein
MVLFSPCVPFIEMQILKCKIKNANLSNLRPGLKCKLKITKFKPENASKNQQTCMKSVESAEYAPLRQI